MTVEADGCLILKLGSSCSVAAANIAGTELGAGVNYTVKKLRDTMGLPVDGDDDAYISVAGPKEWQGWPTTPGARAFVPKDVTVTVGEEDAISEKWGSWSQRVAEGTVERADSDSDSTPAEAGQA